MNPRQAACICAVLSAFLFPAADPPSGKTNDTHAAAVLFENFETVFHTTPPLLADSLVYRGGWYVWEPFGYLRVGLEALEKQAPAKLLADSDAMLVGTKDYHFPIGLGPVRSTRCYVAVLRKESTFDLSRFFREPPVASVADAPVWIWSANLGEFGERDPRPSALFATQLKRSYVVVSNDLEELLNVSGRLTSAGNDAAVLGRVREWNDVSQHQFWGYRKFRHDQIRVTGTISTGAQITPDAEALITYVDLKKKTGVLRLLSFKVDDATAKNINAGAVIPPLKPIGPRVWQTDFPLIQAGGSSESAFWVQWLFGLGVAV